jgi:hypothetical protein
MNVSRFMRGISRESQCVLVAAVLFIDVGAHAATAPLRAYATEWNREAQGLSSAQKEVLIGALLDRWAPAAARFNADASWRDSFGLQLSMLPSATLVELAAAKPQNGFQGILDTVSQSLRLVAEKQAVRSKDLGQTTTDLVFVPINPCRIVDTRFGGGGTLSTSAPRNFLFSNPAGGTFSSQGGSASNCGLAFSGTITPVTPKAIAATVTVVSPSGAGNLVVYPTGTTPGTTSTLNYTAGAVLANSTVIVGAQGVASDFTVALNGPPHSADVIVDAIGYYYAPAASALDCVTASNPSGSTTTGNIAPGAAAIFTVSCTAGYEVTGGGCAYFDTSQQPPLATDNKVFINRSQRPFDNVSQTFANQWLCHWTNNDTITWRVQVRAVCCRIPGH